MNRTAAPKSARILAVCAIVLSGLAFVLYIAAIVLQRQYKELLNYPAELVSYFVVPLVFCILLISSGNKPVWTKGKGTAFVVTEAILLFLSGVLFNVFSMVETTIYAQYGAYMTASYSAVSGLAAKTGDVMTGSAICALIAFSISAYRAALDGKAQVPMGGFR